MDTDIVLAQPFFDRIRAIGYQPFIQIGVQSEIGTEPLHDEFLGEIRDPIFGQQEVWHDFEWEGVAVLSEKDASARMNATVDMTQFVGAAES